MISTWISVGMAACLTCSVASAQTTLLRSGTNGSKFNIVVVGDGFTAGNGQMPFNNYVQNTILNGLFANDEMAETMNAFNIFRINLNSAAAGITTVNASGVVTNNVNTALGWRFSGNWNRCWSEPGPNADATLNNILNNQTPQWDFVILVLNTVGGGRLSARQQNRSDPRKWLGSGGP